MIRTTGKPAIHNWSDKIATNIFRSKKAERQTARDKKHQEVGDYDYDDCADPYLSFPGFDGWGFD